MRVNMANLIRVAALAACNLIVLVSEFYLLKEPSALIVKNLSANARYHPLLGLVLPLLNLLVPVTHTVVSYVLSLNIILAVLNRSFSVVYAFSVGYKSVNVEVVFKELICLVLSVFAITALQRLIGPSSMSLRSLMTLKDLRLTEKMSNLSKGDIIPLFVSHIAGISATLAILVYTGLASHLEIYVVGANCVLVPLLVLLLGTIVSRGMLARADYLALGFISGLGLMGLAPLLLLVTVQLSSNYASRVVYAHKRGLYMGEVKAVLTYGYPRAVYQGAGGKVQAHSRHKETWYWRKVLHPLYVDLSELNTPHIIIVGSSGSGKTTLAKHIAVEASKLYGYNVIVIDQHGEYKDLLRHFNKCKVVDASKCSINPLALENVSPRERALQLAHVISTVFKLGFLQRRMLEEVILRTYELKKIVQENPTTWVNEPPTLRDLVETCKSLEAERPEFGRILPYLVLLDEHMSGGGWLSIEELLLENTIIDMSRVLSDFARALFVDTLMYMLINKMYNLKSDKKVMFILEEAGGILPRSLTRELLSRLFTESRKFGFSIVVVFQEIKGIPKVLVDNAGLRIFFVLNEPRSIEEVSRIMGGPETKEKALIVTEALRTLAQHTFIMHATGVATVFIVKSPFMNSGNRLERA